MGRKKYFCDFCLRSFNDDRNTRLKHLNSVAHMKAKTEHYDMFKDPEVILRENSLKKPCRRFQNDGFCQYGSSCTYSHFSSYDLELIRQEVARRNMEKNNVNVPPASAFLQMYDEIRHRKSRKSAASHRSHELPTSMIAGAHNLPVSLQPFNLKIYENIHLDNWG